MRLVVSYRPWSYWALVLAIAATYFGAAKLGLARACLAEQVTAVSPPTSLALASFLWLGHRVWPGVALGAFLANATHHEPILTNRQWKRTEELMLQTLKNCAFGSLHRWQQT